MVLPRGWCRAPSYRPDGSQTTPLDGHSRAAPLNEASQRKLRTREAAGIPTRYSAFVEKTHIGKLVILCR
jgi:hypothetical protein